MAINHQKVSTIPDDSDTNLVRPSDWNAALKGTIDLTNTSNSTTDVAISGILPAANGGVPTAATKGTIAVYSGSVWTVLAAPSEDNLCLMSASARTTGLKWSLPGYSDWTDEANAPITDEAGNIIEFKD